MIYQIFLKETGIIKYMFTKCHKNNMREKEWIKVLNH